MMLFRPRNYAAEKQYHALPCSRADYHPLSASPSLPHLQVEVAETDYLDPLRRSDNNTAGSREDLEGVEDGSALEMSGEASVENPEKEWVTFKRSLMQRFPVSKTVLASSMADVMVKGRRTYDKSSTNMHLEELEDPEKFAEEGGKVITGQEYVSRLHELNTEINHSWHADDRVTSLKLSITVAKLLMDTSILQCYPTLFALATDIMDMLGDMVWERIKLKAELAEDGLRLCFLPENFTASDICSDAKETCNNWFSKIGAIRELLPRPRTPIDADGILSSIQKLLSLLVMVPGNPEFGVTFYPKNLVLLVNSQPWVTSRMRVKIFCAVVSLLAVLSQQDLPYHADKGKHLGNDTLFFGHWSYLSELALMCKFVLQSLIDTIQQEPSKVARGSMALEACNCIASSFIPCQEISSICSNLIETGKSCMGTSHPYLLSTIKFMDRLPHSSVAL